VTPAGQGPSRRQKPPAWRAGRTRGAGRRHSGRFIGGGEGDSDCNSDGAARPDSRLVAAGTVGRHQPRRPGGRLLAGPQGHVEHHLALPAIGVVAAAMSLAGVMVGKSLGDRFGKPAEIAGAVVLMLLAVSFLIW